MATTTADHIASVSLKDADRNPDEFAQKLGRSFEGNVPEGSHVGIRANPHDAPLPAFVWLGSLKPGVMRDLGL